MENLLVPPGITGSEYLSLGTFITGESLSEDWMLVLTVSNWSSPELNDSERLGLILSDSDEFNLIESDELKLVLVGLISKVFLESEGCSLELMESDGIRQVLMDSEGLNMDTTRSISP